MITLFNKVIKFSSFKTNLIVPSSIISNIAFSSSASTSSLMIEVTGRMRTLEEKHIIGTIEVKQNF